MGTACSTCSGGKRRNYWRCTQPALQAPSKAEPEVEEIFEQLGTPEEEDDRMVLAALPNKDSGQSLLTKLLAAEGPNKETFNVTIERTGYGREAVLGIDCRKSDEVSLMILRIGKGLIAKWNASNPSLSVEEGDRILAVNNACGKASTLLERMLRDRRVELVLSRQHKSVHAKACS
mmetsp:Transcript_41316/g.95672  ORF Transcript_41316/g.95672 Transcript_41316/m.95672 type:complete len:176 (+) Transcript_41316:125-652(+)